MVAYRTDEEGRPLTRRDALMQYALGLLIAGAFIGGMYFLQYLSHR